MLYSTCREPDYVAHGKKEIGEVEEDDTLLGVEEPGSDISVWKRTTGFAQELISGMEREEIKVVFIPLCIEKEGD